VFVAVQEQALLDLMHHVLVAIRTMAGAGPTNVAYEIADSLEELPRKIAAGEPLDVEEFEATYLRALFDDWPELGPLKNAWLKFKLSK